jgi:hypothetical protein
MTALRNCPQQPTSARQFAAPRDASRAARGRHPPNETRSEGFCPASSRASPAPAGMLSGVAHAGDCQLDPEGRRCGRDRRQVTGRRRVVCMVEDCDALDARRKLLEQLQPFHADCKFVLREPRDIAAGSRETRDKTGTNRIGDMREYDGNIGRDCVLPDRSRQFRITRRRAASRRPVARAPRAAMPRQRPPRRAMNARRFPCSYRARPRSHETTRRVSSITTKSNPPR